MNLKRVSIIITILFLLAFGEISCKKSYDPPAISSPGSYIVIEGLINSGGDSTIIKITKTVNLAQATSAPVTKAIVTIEDNQNCSFTLFEKNKGIYFSPGLNIDKTKQYRLRIKTTDNQVYLSDFEPVLTTPPIDSVGFMIKSNGLQLYLNTHDATNSVKHYRWEYEETWQFHSFYYSTAMLQGNAVVARTQDSDIYICFNSDTSKDITLASTSNLSQDVLFQKQIALIPSTSEKIETRYSILVKQYALTPEAYTFYSKLQQNTEQLGSIFSPLPSEVPGNIHCITNPAQPVIGFIGINSITSKRIFISKTSLPATWVATYPSSCMITPADNLPLISLYKSEHPKLFEFIDTALNHSTPICVACTIRGKRTPPPFWVY